MTKKRKTKESFEIEDRFEEIEESLTKTEQFIENNQKQIITVVLALVVIVLGIFAFNKFYKAPQEEKAQTAIFQAQELFDNGSYQQALDGVNKVGDQAPGFLQVIEDYGSTKAGNLAKYYAGISYKNLGEYDKAIAHLNDFDTDDFLLKSVVHTALGDSYFAKEEYKDASNAYKKAMELNPNTFSTPIAMMRLGLTYEKLGQFSEALNIYNTIKEKYPYSKEGRDVAKFIVRARMGLQNTTTQS